VVMSMHCNSVACLLCLLFAGWVSCVHMLSIDCVVIGLLLAILYCGALLVWQGFSMVLWERYDRLRLQCAPRSTVVLIVVGVCLWMGCPGLLCVVGVAESACHYAVCRTFLWEVSFCLLLFTGCEAVCSVVVIWLVIVGLLMCLDALFGVYGVV